MGLADCPHGAQSLFIRRDNIFKWLTVTIATNLYLLGGTNGTIFADCHHCHQSVKIRSDKRGPILSQNENYKLKTNSGVGQYHFD